LRDAAQQTLSMRTPRNKLRLLQCVLKEETLP